MWAKNPWMLIFFSFVTEKEGGEGQKSIISVWNWVCLGNAENSKSQGCASSKAMRGHPVSHWALHPLPAPCGCLSFVPIWICCFVASAPTLGFAQGNCKGRSGNIEGIQVILYHTRNQELMFWIPQVHSFVPIIRKPPSPEPQKKFTGIEGIINCKMNPNSTDRQSVSLAS